MKQYIILLVSTILFTSCLSDNSIDIPNYDAINESDIQDYISKNNLTPTQSTSGLYYIITKEGTGNLPVISSNVTVDYKGYLLDGTVFDQSSAGGATFDLNRLIAGFAEGMTYVKEGGEATLIIPSRLGYGISSVGAIPAGSVLLFDVKLISIN